MNYKIFKGKGKRKLVFSMNPCPESKILKKIIKTHGGVLFKKIKENSICLLPYELGHTFVGTQKYKVYSYKFVYDSIEAHRLLDLGKYELKREEPKAGKRSKYTKEDEEKMIDYVKRTFGNTGVISFWDGMIKEGMKHSSESLRYHWKYVMHEEDKIAAEKIMNENIKAEIMIAQNIKNGASTIPIKSESPLLTNPSEVEDILNGLEAQKKASSLENEKTPSMSRFLENQLKRKPESQIKGKKALKLMSQCQRNLVSKPLDKTVRPSKFKNHCTNPEILSDLRNYKQKINIIKKETDFANTKTYQMLEKPIIEEKTIEIKKYLDDKENFEPDFSNCLNQTSEHAQVTIKKEKKELCCNSEQYYNIEAKNSFKRDPTQKLTAQECIKTETFMRNNQHKLQDFFDKPEDLLIICDNQIRSVHYLNSLCIDVNIEDHFTKLFSLCQKVSKRIITEDDVLHALETKNGVVSDTISSFLDKKIAA